MSTTFERLAKIAKEKYGVDITRKDSSADVTFETLFGISVGEMTELELLYEIPDMPLVIDFCEPAKLDIANINLENIFDVNSNLIFAA